MLVLSRKVEESIVLDTKNGPITVAVTRISGDKVRLGVDAPDDVKILRSELIDEDEVPAAA